MSKDKKLIKVERPTSGICFMVSPSDVESYRSKGYKIHGDLKNEKVNKAEPKEPLQGEPEVEVEDPKETPPDKPAK